MTVEILKNTHPWPELLQGGEYPQLNGHSQAWFEAICRGLRHKPFVLIHRDTHGVANGILPLVLVQSLLFGKFLVSLPYLNTGGPWASDQSVASGLVTRACELAGR